MARFERAALLKRFRDMAKRGEPIVGGGAGTGLSAKCEEAGGVDLIVIYNSGRYRMAGRGSLAGLMAYGDANAIVLEMANEVLPVVGQTPVLAGVNGTDPFRDMDVFLDQLKALGFAGVQNFPTVGLIDGTFRANLEETGMSYALEIDMIAKAHDKDMLTTPYVFSEKEAAAMAIAGADIIVCHMGLTTGGTIGAQTAPKLKDCRGADRHLGDRRAQRQSGHPGAGAWRADRRSRRRGLYHEEYPSLPRLLRGVLDGAAAGGAGADGTSAAIQGDRRTITPEEFEGGKDVRDVGR
ncbi:putative TIM-barrel enzyme [Bradyrhizobium sp. USDA 3397]